jgi:hypothetical protein
MTALKLAALCHRMAVFLAVILFIKVSVLPAIDLIPGWPGGLVHVGILVAIIAFHNDVLAWLGNDDDSTR